MRVGLRGLVQAAAFVTAVFSIATLAGHLHRYLELFSHFRLQYLAAAALLTVVLFALRSRRWAASMLAVAAINVVPVYPWYVSQARASVEPGQDLTLLLANVYSGNSGMQQLTDLALAEDADLVFVQELVPRHSEELARLRTTFRYSLNIPRQDNFGIAVLSRFPFEGAKVIESPPLGHPTLMVEVLVAGTPVTFVTTHPMPPIGRHGFDSRNEQLQSVADVISEIRGPRVLIGDLNTTMWGPHYGELERQTGLVNSRYGFGVLPTWPSRFPFAAIPIDHCLVSEDIVVTDVRNGPDIGSDHRPLIIELALAPQR